MRGYYVSVSRVPKSLLPPLRSFFHHITTHDHLPYPHTHYSTQYPENLVSIARFDLAAGLAVLSHERGHYAHLAGRRDARGTRSTQLCEPGRRIEFSPHVWWFDRILSLSDPDQFRLGTVF